jgi:hypothetical protein
MHLSFLACFYTDSLSSVKLFTIHFLLHIFNAFYPFSFLLFSYGPLFLFSTSCIDLFFLNLLLCLLLRNISFSSIPPSSFPSVSSFLSLYLLPPFPLPPSSFPSASSFLFLSTSFLSLCLLLPFPLPPSSFPSTYFLLFLYLLPPFPLPSSSFPSTFFLLSLYLAPCHQYFLFLLLTNYSDL